MRNSHWKITYITEGSFYSSSPVVTNVRHCFAITQEQAVILTQGQQIREAKEYRFYNVELVKQETF